MNKNTKYLINIGKMFENNSRDIYTNFQKIMYFYNILIFFFLAVEDTK